MLVRPPPDPKWLRSNEYQRMWLDGPGRWRSWEREDATNHWPTQPRGVLLLGFCAEFRESHLYPCLDVPSLIAVISVCLELHADAK